MQRTLVGSPPPARAQRPTRTTPWWRLAAATVTVFLALPAGVAAADAAGPTDYQTRIVAIDPPAPQLHASIIGGDSFLLLRVDRGTAVEVLGYRSEPYIRFLADGTVEENRASASWFVSRSRVGSELPADFDENAAAEWHTVATGGEYAWHDHRTHWMAEGRPPGKRPGDIVLRQDVALLVDGSPTTITVESVWMPAPSTVPARLAAVGGLLIGVLAGLPRRPRWRSAPALALAALATIVGGWQFRSLPAETGPQLVWFALPAIAVVALAAVCALQWRRAVALSVHALRLLAGVNLVLWGWMRRAGLGKAVLPTDAPGWLDRCATAAAVSAGAVLVVVGLGALVRTIVVPAGSATANADAAGGATSSAS